MNDCLIRKKEKEKHEFLIRIREESESKGVSCMDKDDILVMTAENEEASNFLINTIKESYLLTTRQDSTEQYKCIFLFF